MLRQIFVSSLALGRILFFSVCDKPCVAIILVSRRIVAKNISFEPQQRIMSLSGNSSIIDDESVPDCSYYECKNLPTVMLEKCQNNGCTNHQHHLCQVAYQEHHEMELGMSIPMFKQCHNYVEKFIKEKLKKRKKVSKTTNQEEE